MADLDVRIEESLRIKIGEAKNIPPSGNSGRDTFCKVAFNQECIFTTSTVEKSSNPFYGEEFQCEVPIRFRFLSFYLCEKTNKQDKVLGKVQIKKEELNRYHNRDHWFTLHPVDANTEVQGKVHLEIKFDENIGHGSPNSTKHRLSVRVLEGDDLSVMNGNCNPYATVALLRGRGKPKDDIKKTCTKKKTQSPTYDEVFYFDIEKKGQNHDRNGLNGEVGNVEISVSLWHDDSRMSQLSIFPAVFLGEVKIPLKDLDVGKVHQAWYFLQPRSNRQSNHNVGSLRVKICFNADHVFPAEYYNDLRDLLLQSPSVKPITSSAAYLLGEVVESKEEAAHPLVRVFHDHGQTVQFIGTLADWEISKTTDPNTIFRGNTLASKCIDELMKLVGRHYLQDTLKRVIEQIFDEQKPCEIDPTRLRDGEDLKTNMNNLVGYVQKIFEAIVYSGLRCPTLMCEVFYALKDAALKHFPETKEVRYQVVSGFVFLRFFAPAILGPRLFDLRKDMPNAPTHRTLTLISKTIQSMGNIVGAKTHAFDFKEDYMIPLFKKFTQSRHVDAIKMFLDIISSLTRMHQTSIEAPIVLKEGYLIKRAQGRRKFGLKNFKKRYFCLTNHSLSYAKCKGSTSLCNIPIQEILAVEDLQEQAFTRKYMFQVIQPNRALYIQANNCVEEQEWKHILNKVCNMNRDRLKVYHPGAYLKGHWLCCKKNDPLTEGCTPVTGYLPADINIDMDSDRELERIHSLLAGNISKLDKIHDACASQEECIEENGTSPVEIEDTKSCYKSVVDTLKCVRRHEKKHKQYKEQMQTKAVLGSQEFPFGDDVFMLSSMQTRL